MLAALFLNEGHFLLIDEPTNHLDTYARERVSAYLKRKKGFILVSHDRHFLDGCVDHILSLNKTDIEVQSGNFSSYMENFERMQDYERTQNDRLKREITHLQQSARRASGWSDKVESSKYGVQDSGLKADRGYVGHKSAKMMKRAKVIEARTQDAIEQKSKLMKNVETAEELKLYPQVYHTDRMVDFSSVEIVYDGKKVCGPISFTIRQGDRVVLDGKNGSGKSSLLKLLLGQSVGHRGSVSVSSGLVISYVPQDASDLHGMLTDFAIEHHIDESLFKTILRKMDFEREQFEKDLSDFSEGQKKKVLIAKSLCERAHLYVWDEPLNFIDIYSRIQIEQLLRRYSPTMIFVEHDVAFQKGIATNKMMI